MVHEGRVKSEAYYLGKGGELYLGRNRERLLAESLERSSAIRSLVPRGYGQERWLEVGCGIGTNLCEGDVGVDYDPRVVRELTRYWRASRLGLVARAQELSCFTEKTFSVVFCVGLLMHLPDGEWQKAMGEMTRVSRWYVIVGEYLTAFCQHALSWEDQDDLLWERPYPAPAGWRVEKVVHPLSPFDRDVVFLVFRKKEKIDEKAD